MERCDNPIMTAEASTASAINSQTMNRMSLFRRRRCRFGHGVVVSGKPNSSGSPANVAGWKCNIGTGFGATDSPPSGDIAGNSSVPKRGCKVGRGRKRGLSRDVRAGGTIGRTLATDFSFPTLSAEAEVPEDAVSFARVTFDRAMRTIGIGD